MTRREAVKRALAFAPASPVPYNLDFTHDMRRKLQEHFGREDVDEAVGNYMLQINVGSNAGAEVNRVAAGLMKRLGPGHWLDEFGVDWDKSAGDDIGLPANQVVDAPDAGKLVLPDPADPLRWKGYEQLKGTAGDRYVMACFSSPLFQRAWFLRGMAQWLMDLAGEPEFVEALLDKLMSFSLGIVAQIARRGADGVFFYDDYAQQTGLMLSPGMFRQFFKPRLARIFAAVRQAGMDVFFHSCGDVSTVLEDLREAGVQAFNPFQPEVMNVEETARRFAGRMAFYGGVSTQKTLPYGKPDDVRAEVRRLRKTFAGGGYILAPAHALQRDVPVENVLALLEAAREA